MSGSGSNRSRQPKIRSSQKIVTALAQIGGMDPAIDLDIVLRGRELHPNRFVARDPQSSKRIKDIRLNRAADAT